MNRLKAYRVSRVVAVGCGPAEHIRPVYHQHIEVHSRQQNNATLLGLIAAQSPSLFVYDALL